MSNDRAVDLALELKQKYYAEQLWVRGSYPATYPTLKDYLESRGFSGQWIKDHAWVLK